MWPLTTQVCFFAHTPEELRRPPPRGAGTASPTSGGATTVTGASATGGGGRGQRAPSRAAASDSGRSMSASPNPYLGLQIPSPFSVPSAWSTSTSGSLPSAAAPAHHQQPSPVTRPAAVLAAPLLALSVYGPAGAAALPHFLHPQHGTAAAAAAAAAMAATAAAASAAQQYHGNQASPKSASPGADASDLLRAYFYPGACPPLSADAAGAPRPSVAACGLSATGPACPMAPALTSTGGSVGRGLDCLRALASPLSNGHLGNATSKSHSGPLPTCHGDAAPPLCTWGLEGAWGSAVAQSAVQKESSWPLPALQFGPGTGIGGTDADFSGTDAGWRPLF